MDDKNPYKIILNIISKLYPYVLLSLSLKMLIWFFESASWWPKINNPGIIIGVIGFGIAILLGAKLSVVNSRLYSIEDAVCRIVGSLRIFVNKKNVSKDIKGWAENFEVTLFDPAKEGIVSMRNQTDILIKKLVTEGHDGPNLSGFSRDVSYVLHRSTAEIPVAYEYFLTMISILYTLMIAVMLPGIAGFIAILIVVVVLMGAAVIIEDMDHPLDNSPTSLIVVNLEPLRHFIGQNKA
ncbi:MAG: hypothetical protein CMM37_08955 [Rhodospirillaceae bacterium]|jgi:hypothetical protein|nr:hypothetical protein [Rhodospirillaceae bacterium]